MMKKPLGAYSPPAGKQGAGTLAAGCEGYGKGADRTLCDIKIEIYGRAASMRRKIYLTKNIF
ncbi:MAG: hypothetical protein LBB47_06160 [Spirochaetaceae bacterium]|nr:hypothetical protein [Spirochaetaceae bacterium]